MKTLSTLLLLLNLSSCALLSPNPNRKSLSSEATLELKPFTTDYCSDFPNGTLSKPNLWADCCFSHDLHYWIGGTEQERQDSDLELKACVKRTGASFDSFLMYMGVRVGGKPGEASYSWGYGWTIKRDYLQVPKNDIKHAIELLKISEHYKKDNTQRLINDFIEIFLKRRINLN